MKGLQNLKRLLRFCLYNEIETIIKLLFLNSEHFLNSIFSLFYLTFSLKAMAFPLIKATSSKSVVHGSGGLIPSGIEGVRGFKVTSSLPLVKKVLKVYKGGSSLPSLGGPGLMFKLVYK